MSGQGFASMGKDQRHIVASMGGRAAHAAGNAHEFNSQTAAVAGQLGGNTVVQTLGLEHMSRLGQAGAAALLRKRGREWMATIGRRGGTACAAVKGRAGMAALGKRGGECRARRHKHASNHTPDGSCGSIADAPTQHDRAGAGAQEDAA